MLQNNWCSHTAQFQHDIGIHEINNWSFCPICGTPKPKPQDEIELYEIIKNACKRKWCGNAPIMITLFNLIKKDILKWKRGEQ